MKLDIETNIVYNKLKEDETSRNDRNFLYCSICYDELMKKWYNHTEIWKFISMLNFVPKESNIIRQAAVIQNNMWLYSPTDKVRKGRKEKEMKCREEYWIDYKEVKPKQWFFARLFNNK